MYLHIYINTKITIDILYQMCYNNIKLKKKVGKTCLKNVDLN